MRFTEMKCVSTSALMPSGQRKVSNEEIQRMGGGREQRAATPDSPPDALYVPSGHPAGSVRATTGGGTVSAFVYWVRINSRCRSKYPFVGEGKPWEFPTREAAVQEMAKLAIGGVSEVNEKIASGFYEIVPVPAGTELSDEEKPPVKKSKSHAMNRGFENKTVYRIWVKGPDSTGAFLGTFAKGSRKIIKHEFATMKEAENEINKLTEGDVQPYTFTVVAVAPAGSLGPMPVAELHIGRALRSALDREFDEKWEDYWYGGVR
jgi:hypothetical protein